MPSARTALHASLSRWYQPGPDVAICRRELSLLSTEARGTVAGMLDVIGALHASSDPIAMLDDEDLLSRCLEVSRPDRPCTLTLRYRPAVTHFTRTTFNLTGQPPHSVREPDWAARSIGQGAVFLIDTEGEAGA